MAIRGIGKEQDPGEYVVRLEKRGLSVTFSIGVEDKDGKFEADVTQTFPTSPKRRRISPAGTCTFSSAAVSTGRCDSRPPRRGRWNRLGRVSASPVRPGRPADDRAAGMPGVQFILSANKDGVLLPYDHFIRTRKGDFLDRDFVFDMWLQVGDGKEGSAEIGLGTGLDAHDQTNTVALVVEIARRHEFRRRKRQKRLGSGRIHRAHQKKGKSVSFSLGSEKGGASRRTHTQTFPSITNAPSTEFNNRNMHIFFTGGRFKQMRISTASCRIETGNWAEATEMNLVSWDSDVRRCYPVRVSEVGSERSAGKQDTPALSRPSSCRGWPGS